MILALAASFVNAEEPVEPKRRKATYRVYDQRPILRPGDWSDSTRESPNATEFLPGAEVKGFKTDDRQYGASPVAQAPLPLPSQPAAPSRGTEKPETWLKPKDFLMEDDLLFSQEGTESVDGESMEEELMDWKGLSGEVLDKELGQERPESQQDQTFVRDSLPAQSGGTAVVNSGLALAPVVAEPLLGSPGPRSEPPSRLLDEARESSLSTLPPAMRLDASPAAGNAPPSVFELSGSRAALIEASEHLRKAAASPAVLSAGLSPPRFAPASVDLPAPPSRFQPVSAPALAPPASSPPAPQPPMAIDRFRGEDYRLRARAGMQTP